MGCVAVYFLDDSELIEMESIHKGYRNDIYTNVDHQYFKLVAYDIVRLQQDFESRLDEYGYFDIESNIILVKEVSKKEILFTLEKLHEENFFDEIKSIDMKHVNMLDSKEIIIKHNFWGDRKLIRVN